MLPLLQGLKILDLTSVILGPFATQILGDLGAEVVKVEPPDGDTMRPIPPMGLPGLSALFANNNRNKRSIVLDLKTVEGREVLGRLVQRSDAFVHNMRQEAMDRLGFGFEAVRALNPRIVYAAAIGFGSGGPYAGKPAYDDIIQSASGLAGLFEMRDGTPAIAPNIIADKVTGLHLVYAVLAGLLHRERTGEGGLNLEVPMFETMTAFLMNEHLSGATFGGEEATGYHRVLSANRKPYRTADGWVAVLPYTKAHWAKALVEIGREDVTREAWFDDPTELSRHIGELYGLVAAALPARTTAAWLEAFGRLDIPHAPVNRPEDLLRDPHLDAVGFYATNFDRATPVKRTMRQPLVMHGAEATPDRPPPLLGADGAEILGELGYSREDVARLTGGRAAV